MKALLLILLVALAIARFGEGFYVRATASEAVKLKCAREPVDFLRRWQYTDCLRRAS